MKLSLFQIVEKFPFPYKVIRADMDNMQQLTRVRLLPSESDQLSVDTLYIVNPSDVVKFSFEGIHVVLAGNSHEVGIFHKAASITVIEVENPETSAIFQEIQEIFEKYQLWENDILSTILHYTSLQDILDKCSVMIKNPIALFDTQQTLLIKSGTIPENPEKAGLWEFAIKHGYSPRETDSMIELADLIAKERLPFYFSSKNKYRNIQRMIAVLYRGESIFGILALSDVTALFTQGEYDTVCLIQKYIEDAISHTNEFHFNSHNTPWFIIQLLRNQHIDSSVLDYNIRRYNHTNTEPFFMWTFQRNSESETSISTLIPNLSYALKTDLVFYFEKQIVVIDHNTEHYQNKIHNQLHNLMIQNKLKSGSSMIFNNLLELHTAFCRHKLLWATENKDDHSAFINNFQAYLKNIINIQVEGDGLIFPGIEAVFSKEPKYANDLLECLQNYIFTGLNVSATSKALGIHRHTVVYRVKK